MREPIIPLSHDELVALATLRRLIVSGLLDELHPPARRIERRPRPRLRRDSPTPGSTEEAAGPRRAERRPAGPRRSDRARASTGPGRPSPTFALPRCAASRRGRRSRGHAPRSSCSRSRGRPGGPRSASVRVEAGGMARITRRPEPSLAIRGRRGSGSGLWIARRRLPSGAPPPHPSRRANGRGLPPSRGLPSSRRGTSGALDCGQSPGYPAAMASHRAPIQERRAERARLAGCLAITRRTAPRVTARRLARCPTRVA